MKKTFLKQANIRPVFRPATKPTGTSSWRSEDSAHDQAQEASNSARGPVLTLRKNWFASWLHAPAIP